MLFHSSISRSLLRLATCDCEIWKIKVEFESNARKNREKSQTQKQALYSGTMRWKIGQTRMHPMYAHYNYCHIFIWWRQDSKYKSIGNVPESCTARRIILAVSHLVSRIIKANEIEWNASTRRLDQAQKWNMYNSSSSSSSTRLGEINFPFNKMQWLMFVSRIICDV